MTEQESRPAAPPPHGSGSRSPHPTLQLYARLAGFLLLFYIAVYFSGASLMGSYHVRGDFALTAANIGASELLYRASLVLQLAGDMTAIALGWAFYVLLKPVHENLALFGLLWRAGEAIVGAVAAMFRFLALGVFAGGAGSVAPEAQQALASLMSGGARAAFPIAVIYFSLGSAVFFHLLLKSRFIPPALAALGLVGSVLAFILGLATLLIPAHGAILRWLWAPLLLAEVGTGFWLLARGANFGWLNCGSADGATPVNG